MTAAFLEMINRSIAAGYLVLLIMLLRLVFRRMPKWVTVLLWGFVAFRLVCPVSLESSLSLIPSAQVISPEILLSDVPAVHTGISSWNQAVNPVLQENFTPDPVASANPLQIILPVLSLLWLLGMAGMLLYTGCSYLRLRRRVGDGVRLEGNLYQSEAVGSPFILGLFAPRIYLPYGLSQEELDCVVAHERMHLRRRDHWWKPLGVLLLSLSWFHPLMWAAYILLCRDIELACDEAAVNQLTPLERAAYSQTLLNLSLPRRQIAACPLAFGEIGVKERVKRVLSYKKPAFWLLLLCLVLCAAIAVTFLTNPSTKGLELLHSLEEADIVSVQSQTILEDMTVSGTTFYDPDDGNLHRILPQLRSAKAAPIARPWGAKNNAEVRFIIIFFRSDAFGLGKNHITAEIVGNRYLSVEGDWYEADPAWLASLPPDGDEYTWLTTITQEDIETVEFIPEPGSGIREAETIRLVQFLNRMQIPATGYPEVLPERKATYRITTTDGQTREIAILGTKYLMIGDVLYEVGESLRDLTEEPQDLSQLPLPGDLEAALLQARDGQPLALLFGTEALNALLSQINRCESLGELSSLDNTQATLHLFWANGDRLSLPIDNDQTQLWQQFGFSSSPELPEQRDAPLTLPNDLYTQVVVMPKGTAAVSGPEWLEGNRGETSHIYALTTREGQYWLRLFKGNGVLVRTFRQMIPVESEGKTHYVLTNSSNRSTSLTDITDQDYLLLQTTP